MYTAEQIKTVLCFVFGGLIREAITQVIELSRVLSPPWQAADDVLKAKEVGLPRRELCLMLDFI